MRISAARREHAWYLFIWVGYSDELVERALLIAKLTTLLWIHDRGAMYVQKRAADE